MTQEAGHALIIPGDDPPRRSSIKRQLLFFNVVSIPDPNDSALINDDEIQEQLRERTFRWARRAPFPRTEGYAETMNGILAETADLRRRGKLRILTRDQSRRLVDPGSHWVAYSLAIRDEKFLRAAIPDFHQGDPESKAETGLISGGEVSIPGVRSKYAPPPGQPGTVPGVGERWNALGKLRVGRVLKYLRIATADSAVPLALDLPNANLLKSFSDMAFAGIPGFDQMADNAIAVDAVDPIALEKALIDVSWPETLKLRKLILPHTAILRALLVRRVTHASHSRAIEAADFLREIHELRNEYEKAQDELAKKWTEAGLGLVTRALPVTAAFPLGLTALAVPLSTGQLIFSILAGLAGGAGTMTNEIKGWFGARESLKSHPLFFFDGLPDLVRSKCEETRPP